MTWILGIIKIIVLLGTLITIHELGHFLVARLFKVKVLKFAIGFGPKIFTKTTKNTEYTLRLIPFGGFVQMEGEEERSDDEDAFNKKSVWQRILIVAAGAIVNIVFALIIYFCICSAQNIYETSIITELETNSPAYEAGLRSGDEIKKINGKRTWKGFKVDEEILKAKNDEMIFEIERYGEKITLPITIKDSVRGLLGVGFSEAREVAYIYENTPAATCGIELGDIVIAINGITTYTTNEIVEIIRALPEQEISITILRNNETINLNTKTLADSKRHFDLNFQIIRPGFWKGLKYALDDVAWYFGANMEAYAQIFTGKAENVEVMGVVGIANEITKTSAWIDFFYMMCAISLSLGIFNLLPIPALDGGRILLLIIEWVRRKPLDEKLEQRIILIGFAIIILFALVVTFMDVSKLFT